MIVEKRPAALSPGQTSAGSTTVFLLGLAVTYIALPSDTVEHVFSAAAIGIGVSLLGATILEGMSGIRGLIRVDIMMLWVLYGLTFLEFVFPQPDVNNSISADTATMGTAVAMVGFAGLALGRHIVPGRYKIGNARSAEVTPRQIFFLFVIAAFFGYLPLVLSVNFDLFEMLRQMSLPRFVQSWQRGRYGDFYALLWEIGALLYLVPPIAGVVCARPQDYGVLQKAVVAAILVLTVYYGFSSGTRNVLAVYTISFFGAYYLAKPDIKLLTAMVQGGLIVSLLLVSMSYMLEFRNVGMNDFSFSDGTPTKVYIDHNMVVLAQLTNAFPGIYDYLGWEIPVHALIHPIPRALWSGKPQGLSVTVESIVGTDQATIGCTFIGEAYMMAGVVGVVIAALGFGIAAQLWNRVRTNENSVFSQLLYASGFFCAAISMRSMLWTTVTMLPALALWLYGRVWLASRPRTI